MPMLHADALHPDGPCAGCRKAMVTRTYARTHAVPDGAVVHSANGQCRTCASGANKRHRAARGEPMPHEATMRGYESWARARAARIAARQGVPA